jgi:hypothetical protein
MAIEKRRAQASRTPRRLHQAEPWPHSDIDAAAELQRAGIRVLLTRVRGQCSTEPSESSAHVTSAGRIDDISVASYHAASHVVFLAGDVAQADLMTLDNAVAAPLYRELAPVV